MFKTRNSRGFTIAEVAALLGVTALLGSFLVPSLASVGNSDVNNSTITVSESSVVVAEPETLPVEAILVNVTNTTTGETVSRTVNDPNATSTTIAGLDPQANYTVEVAKKSQAGMSAKATARVDYIKVAEETKQGTRPVEVDDTTKPIMVDDTTRPIMGQVDRGSYKQRTVWVDTSYWVDTSGWQNQPVYGWGWCYVSSGYWSTCSSSYYDSCASYSCWEEYSHYACFNSACTSGAPRYKTVCGCSGGWISYSWSCYVDNSYHQSCWTQTGSQNVWVSSGYVVSQGYNTTETYWAPNMVTEVVGYEKMVAGYQKKTITETFNYQVDVRQAVTTAKSVTAPAGQLVIEVASNPRRSFNWASGTVVAVGAGVSGYTKGETVQFRNGTVFTFDGKQYLRVPAQSFLVRK
jgi:hypothetical protein